MKSKQPIFKKTVSAEVLATINRLNPRQVITVKAGFATFAGRFTGVIFAGPRGPLLLDYLTIEIRGDVAVLDKDGRKVIGTRTGFKTQHIPLINVNSIK